MIISYRVTKIFLCTELVVLTDISLFRPPSTVYNGLAITFKTNKGVIESLLVLAFIFIESLVTNT